MFVDISWARPLALYFTFFLGSCTKETNTTTNFRVNFCQSKFITYQLVQFYIWHPFIHLWNVIWWWKTQWPLLFPWTHLDNSDGRVLDCFAAKVAWIDVGIFPVTDWTPRVVRCGCVLVAAEISCVSSWVWLDLEHVVTPVSKMFQVTDVLLFFWLQAPLSN